MKTTTKTWASRPKLKIPKIVKHARLKALEKVERAHYEKPLELKTVAGLGMKHPSHKTTL